MSDKQRKTIKRKKVKVSNEQITKNIKPKVREQRKDNKVAQILLAFFLFSLFFFPSSLLIGLDFNFSPGGFVFIPMGEGNTLYDTGGGGEIGFEADLSTIWPNPLGLGYTFGLEAAMLLNPLQSEQAENVSFYSAGGNFPSAALRKTPVCMPASPRR